MARSHLRSHWRIRANYLLFQMADRIVEHVHTEGGGGGALTVLAVVLALLVLLAVLYFAGVFRQGPAKHEIDINVNKPGVVLQLY